jgi:dATP/dGTP pyrophosphohydrolase
LRKESLQTESSQGGREAMRINCPHCGAEASIGIVQQPGEATCGACQRQIPSLEPLFVIETYLRRQQIWSLRTFGEGQRTAGIVKHIQKELAEILARPHDLTEWIDVVILALDGYWRHGGGVDAIMDYLQAKQNTNFARTWPAPVAGEPAEHDRSRDDFVCTECKHHGPQSDPAKHSHPRCIHLRKERTCGAPAPPGMVAQPGWMWRPCNFPPGHKGMHQWIGAPASYYCKRVPPIREKDRPAHLGEPCECLEGACIAFGITPCEWCRDGYIRTRSSVSEKFVHTDTPVGRVVCKCP